MKYLKIIPIASVTVVQKKIKNICTYFKINNEKKIPLTFIINNKQTKNKNVSMQLKKIQKRKKNQM